ncbi:MAG: glycosyltransferase family 4 protein [bacterium]
MRALFLPQSCELGPSSRYRVYQLLPDLQEHGIESKISPALDAATYTDIYLRGSGSRSAAFRATRRQRKADLQRLDEFDTVFVQKGVFPGLYSGFERRIAARKPLVFDLDDAIWLPREGGNSLLRWLHNERKVQEVMHCAAAVIAGNAFLADYARQFNCNVTIVPSSIDTAKYPPAADSDVVGWIGSRTTLHYLKVLAPMFAELKITPRVIASDDSTNLGFAADFQQWTLEGELNELAGIGIGIAPLPDNAWERGKCGVKLLQYMAAGIPVVASPVGVHKEIVKHGVNGFLAEHLKDWRNYLRELLNDPALRHRLGTAGRETVLKRYDVRRAAAKVARVLAASTQKIPGY